MADLFSVFLFYNSWTHSLFKNNNWISSKTKLEKGVMGAWSFFVTYRALAHNHIDLGTWHGYQEVFYKKNINSLKDI